ncbi:MAG: contractile injection system tape measure protein [Lentimicrobium sp.]
MTHQIRNQFIEVEFTGTEAAGLELQRMMPDLFYHKLLPALEKAFDHSFPPDLVLKIDRIEVNAGTIDFDRLASDLADSVVKEIMKDIQKGEAGKGATTPGSIHGIIKPVSISENLTDVFIYFLKTGSLPWNFRLQDGTTLEDELTSILDATGMGALSDFQLLKIKEILTNHDAVKRLVSQFTHPFHSRLLRLLSPEVAEIAGKIFSRTDKESLLPEIRGEFRKCLFESAFNYTSISGYPTELGLIIQLAGMLPERLNSIAEISGIIDHSSKSKPILSEGRQNGKPNSDYMPVSEKEGFYIDNAGLVLLHPFLPRFFETLGVTKNDEIIGPSRALRLLHFLATGQTSAQEYLLVLPKILCEVPVFAPVSIDEIITANEFDESMALLTAVILHWSALRNTSPDALRETFLKRRGKLYQENGRDWILQVESQTFDVLLGQLPWGLGHVKLPWMKTMLSVEWGV